MFNIFIKRPVMAIVLSLIIVFLGFLSIRTLPTSQFPDIAPPRVIVSLAYPGASADVLRGHTDGASVVRRAGHEIHCLGCDQCG